MDSSVKALKGRKIFATFSQYITMSWKRNKIGPLLNVNMEGLSLKFSFKLCHFRWLWSWKVMWAPRNLYRAVVMLHALPNKPFQTIKSYVSAKYCHILPFKVIQGHVCSQCTVWKYLGNGTYRQFWWKTNRQWYGTALFAMTLKATRHLCRTNTSKNTAYVAYETNYNDC